MNTSVAKPDDFQTRMFERIKAQMGELMTDEELKKIFDLAMHKAFFEPTIRVINPGGWNSEKREEPSVFVTLIKEHLSEKIDELAKQWMKDNHEEVFRLLMSRFDEGLVKMIGGAFDRVMNDKFMNFQSSMIEMIRTMPR